MPRQKYFCRGINVTFMTQMNRHRQYPSSLEGWGVKRYDAPTGWKVVKFIPMKLLYITDAFDAARQYTGYYERTDISVIAHTLLGAPLNINAVQVLNHTLFELNYRAAFFLNSHACPKSKYTGRWNEVLYSGKPDTVCIRTWDWVKIQLRT